ncbi:MAG: four helix bundle protein [Saprospiraceae bacterium]|nr:four helix bundle protein [Saprospiraceae bacterium]
MGDFRKLNVWIKSKDLAVRIYKITDDGLFAKDFRFRDQIRSAAISVVPNIAEGDELKTNSQSVNFLYYAKGSTAEVITQLIVAFEIGYIDIENFNDLVKEYEHVSHMLAKLIIARKP